MKKALLLSLVLAVATSFAQTATIDFNTTYQTIRGFGGMNHTTWINDLNDDVREKSFGNEPGKIGLSILRIHLDPDSTAFKLEVPTASFAIQKGATVFATPWNAPNRVLDGTASKSRVDPAKYGEYVNHLNQFNTFMTNKGVPLYAISVQNEPDYGEWTRWTDTEMLNFVKNYADKINHPRVIAAESFQFRRGYTDPLLNDAQAAANFEIVGGHIYGGGLLDYPLARTKGKEVWMTEHLLGSDDGRVNNWELAVTVGKEINDCMIANYNAYVWWYIRRSYGLITDDGNITDKGYVMSQFSKFVRPGALRIGATVASASNIHATAYKTDTSFVMVVVNKNASSVNLNTTILNGTVTKLTKFTTSETKKMVNDGDVTVSGSEFVAAVAANSVTTFTSYADNGGKAGNKNPTAIASNDLDIIDEAGVGFATFTLDGSLSSDQDGSIQNYSWSLNGQQVGTTAKYEAKITSAGIFKYKLTVTDNDGATASDEVIVTMTSPFKTEIWLEAENGTVGKIWQKKSDINASNGMYVMATAGAQRLTSPSNNPDSIIVYNFKTTETGIYKIWGRTIAKNSNDDSFWVKVDNQDWINWNSIPSGTSWNWDDVHNQSVNNVVEFEFEPGDHTLSICFREDGAQLDKILITNTGFMPEGIGGTPNGIDFIPSNLSKILISPNPSKRIVNIEWTVGFNSLNVFNQMGQLVYTENFDTLLQKKRVDFDLKRGIYFISVRGNKQSGVSKLIIES